MEKYPTQNCASYNFPCFKVTRKGKAHSEILLKNIIQDPERWKHTLCSWMERLNIIKMSVHNTFICNSKQFSE